MKNLYSVYSLCSLGRVIGCCDWCSFRDIRFKEIAQDSDLTEMPPKCLLGHSTWLIIKNVLRIFSIPILLVACSAQTVMVGPVETSISSYRAKYGFEEKTQGQTWPVLARSNFRSLKYVRLSKAIPVRAMSNANGSGAGQSGGTVSVPIPMTDVTGLMEALSQINNSIATLTTKLNSSGASIPMTNVTGLDGALSQINASIASLTATVNSYNSTIQNLASVPTFVDFEIPVGTVDGSNATFILNAAPSPPSSLILTKNGMKLNPTADYSLSGNTIVFSQNAIPQPGDVLSAMYRLASSSR
ncbi:MAG: hypothetical protein ACR2IV_07725 [Bryobacteraceae bacterium]